MDSAQIKFFPSLNKTVEYVNYQKVYNYIWYYLNRLDEKETIPAFVARTNMKDVSKADALDLLQNYRKTITHASSIAKFEDSIAQVSEAFKINLQIPYTKYSVIKQEPIFSTNDVKPNMLVIRELNIAFPALTGFFFEHMLAQCLDCENITTEHEILTNSEFKKEDVLEIINGKFSELPKNDINTLAKHAIFALLVKSDFTYDVEEKLFTFLQVINTKRVQKMIMKYWECLKGSYLVRKMSEETDLKHSEHCSNLDGSIVGEMDFYSNSYITDIKVYKQEQLQLWASQLHIYKKIVGNSLLKLRLVNMFSGQIYEFDTSAGEMIDEEKIYEDSNILDKFAG